MYAKIHVMSFHDVDEHQSVIQVNKNLGNLKCNIGIA